MFFTCGQVHVRCLMQKTNWQLHDCLNPLFALLFSLVVTSFFMSYLENGTCICTHIVHAAFSIWWLMAHLLLCRVFLCFSAYFAIFLSSLFLMRFLFKTFTSDVFGSDTNAPAKCVSCSAYKKKSFSIDNLCTACEKKRECAKCRVRSQARFFIPGSEYFNIRVQIVDTAC